MYDASSLTIEKRLAATVHISIGAQNCPYSSQGNKLTSTVHRSTNSPYVSWSSPWTPGPDELPAAALKDGSLCSCPKDLRAQSGEKPATHKTAMLRILQQ